MSALSVGLFTYSTLPRGSVVHTANLADALHDAGADVTVYALDKDARGFFRPLRARLALVPASHTPASTAELVKTRARSSPITSRARGRRTTSTTPRTASPRTASSSYRARGTPSTWCAPSITSRRSPTRFSTLASVDRSSRPRFAWR